jgi:hypothetical protein
MQQPRFLDHLQPLPASPRKGMPSAGAVAIVRSGESMQLRFTLDLNKQPTATGAWVQTLLYERAIATRLVPIAALGGATTEYHSELRHPIVMFCGEGSGGVTGELYMNATGEPLDRPPDDPFACAYVPDCLVMPSGDNDWLLQFPRTYLGYIARANSERRHRDDLEQEALDMLSNLLLGEDIDDMLRRASDSTGSV